MSIPCCALSRPPRAVVVAFVTAGSLLFVSVCCVLFLLVSIFGHSAYFIDEDKVDKKRKRLGVGRKGRRTLTKHQQKQASSHLRPFVIHLR